MKLLLDANLAPSMAALVRDAGYDCSHMTEFLPANATDLQVAELANRLAAALVTKDADFFDLKIRGILEVTLVWLRSGNMSTRSTARLLLPALPGIATAIQAGEHIIEIR